MYKKGFMLPDDVWLVDLDSNQVTSSYQWIYYYFTAADTKCWFCLTYLSPKWSFVCRMELKPYYLNFLLSPSVFCGHQSLV